MAGMSDRLKETLGIMDKRGIELKEIPSGLGDEEAIVPSRGGDIIPFEAKNVPTSIPDTEHSDIKDDYIVSRNITHTLIDMTGTALQGAMDVAIETQHPKAFTIFNELATTMRGLSKDLLEMQKIYKEITAEKAAREAAAAAKNVTQNTININTSSMSEVLDLLDRMDEAEGGKVIDIN